MNPTRTTFGATAGAAIVLAAWAAHRFNRRPARLAVESAEQIVADEARRMSREIHPSMWGRA